MLHDPVYGIGLLESQNKVDESLSEEEDTASNEDVSGSGEEGSGEESSGVDGSGSGGAETELVGGEIIGSGSTEPMTVDVVNAEYKTDAQLPNAPKDEGFMDYEEKRKIDRPTQTDDNEQTNSESNEGHIFAANDDEHVQNDVEVVVTAVDSATHEKDPNVDKDYSELDTDTEQNKIETTVESEEFDQMFGNVDEEYEQTQSEEESESENEPQTEEEPEIEKEPESEEAPQNRLKRTEAEHRNDEGHVSVVAVASKESQQNKGRWLFGFIPFKWLIP
ncbi:unnamed protein product [Owenia fusiformis]|uniref:Uncharacterized protein n=1 Tax=Owenia fusiformis TaxID=6347 RepID=A0A8S4NRV7_OWEFU|nr:unnamed protein product [Owenia fusiformis]